MAILECSDNTHMKILKKQLELKEKYGNKPYIKDMVDIAINKGIDSVEEELGLKKSNGIKIAEGVHVLQSLTQVWILNKLGCLESKNDFILENIMVFQ